MIKQLPCSSCTALCCGPVPISEARLKTIREHLSGMPEEERKRLERQRRREMDCGFLDQKGWRCTVYPVRPLVCEIYGRTEGLECPMIDGLVQILPMFAVDERMKQELRTPIAGISSAWNWKKMDFE